jgi:exonuclease SbcC
MIKTLILQNLKGKTGTFECHPVTLVHGLNGSGKTTIPDALALALLGHVPRVGKTNQAIASLASALPMSVEAVTRSGARYKLTASSKGSAIKITTDGEPPVMPAILFTPSLWLEASPAARLKMIRDHITGLVAESEEIWQKLLASIKQTEFNVKGETAEDRIAAMTAFLATEKATAAAMVKRFKETIQGLETLDLISDTDEVALPDLKAMRDGIRDIIDQLQSKRTEVDRMQTTFTFVQEKVTRLKRELEELPAEPTAALPVLEERIQRAIDLQRETQGKIATAKMFEQNQRLNARQIAQKQELEEFLKAGVPAISETVRLDSEWAVSKDELERMKQALANDEREVKAMQSSIEKMKASFESKTCPSHCQTCGAAKEAWTIDPLESAKEELLKTESALLSRKEKLDAAREEMANQDRYQAALKECQEQTAYIEKREAAETELAGIEFDLQTYNAGAEQFDLEKLEDIAQNIEIDLQELSDQISAWKQRSRAGEKEQELAEARAYIDQLNADIDAAEAQGATIQETLEHARAGLEAAEKLTDTATDLRVKAQQLHEAKAALEKAKEEVADFDHGLVKCKEATEEIGKLNILPVVDRANQFLAGVFDWKLTHHEGTLGRWEELNWVKLETFSGAETKIVLAAIAAALSAESPFKLLIVDELASVDRSRVLAFYCNVTDAVKTGEIDQAFLLDIDPPKEELESLTGEWFGVIDMNPS